MITTINLRLEPINRSRILLGLNTGELPTWVNHSLVDVPKLEIPSRLQCNPDTIFLETGRREKVFHGELREVATLAYVSQGALIKNSWHPMTHITRYIVAASSRIGPTNVNWVNNHLVSAPEFYQEFLPSIDPRWGDEDPLDMTWVGQSIQVVFGTKWKVVAICPGILIAQTARGEYAAMRTDNPRRMCANLHRS